jgi:hypothetical protein
MVLMLVLNGDFEVGVFETQKHRNTETQKHGGTGEKVATRRQTVGYQSTVIYIQSALESGG